MFSDDELVRRVRDPGTRSVEIINDYYTRCIPVYREILGDHWHTGFYQTGPDPIGLDDQLRMERWIASMAGVDRTSRVLDVGCGVGGPATHLAMITGASIVGLTPNAAQLSIANGLATAVGVSDRVHFELGHAGHLPFPDGAFDTVLFFESICHVPDKQQFFREAFRVLKPGGRLAGEDWLAVDGLAGDDIDRFILPICDGWAIPGLGTLAEYQAAMELAGFQTIRVIDSRDVMPLSRGFAVGEADQEELRQDLAEGGDPIRRMIMEGLLRLGEAVAAGKFTVGAFLADRLELAKRRGCE